MPTTDQYHHMMAIMKTIDKCSNTLRQLLQENQENDDVLKIIDKLMYTYSTGVRAAAEEIKALKESEKK
jgi:hypothetical protein